MLRRSTTATTATAAEPPLQLLTSPFLRWLRRRHAVHLGLRGNLAGERLVLWSPPPRSRSRAGDDNRPVAAFREVADETRRTLDASAADRREVVGEEEDAAQGGGFRRVGVPTARAPARREGPVAARARTATAPHPTGPQSPARSLTAAAPILAAGWDGGAKAVSQRVRSEERQAMAVAEVHERVVAPRKGILRLHPRVDARLPRMVEDRHRREVPHLPACARSGGRGRVPRSR